MMLRQLPMESVAEIELVPQAIILQPRSYFENNLGITFTKDRDDFDEFDGAALQIDGNFRFALKHYAGYPDGTMTVYLPFEIGNVEQVTAAIRHVAEELHIEAAWITWQRKDDPDL